MERPQDDRITDELDKISKMFHLYSDGYVLEAIDYVTNKVGFGYDSDFAVALIQEILTKRDRLLNDIEEI